MKIHYLAILAAVSLLTLGTVTGCSTPPTTTAPTTTDASKANPCASKTNPCAAKTNPCAAKAKSVGAPLVQQLQGKPVVVDVYASWCAACKNIAPTLSQLKKDYAGKANFVVLDVSDKSTTAEAEAKAKQLGLSQFLSANKTQTGSLTIIDPSTGKILAQHRNNPNLADYTSALDAALKQ